MRERSPKNHIEQHDTIPLTLYSKRLKSFTEEILPREFANGDTKSLLIPVSAEDVQKKLRMNLDHMLVDPSHKLESFDKRFESTHVKLFITGWNHETDIVPDEASERAKKVVFSSGWKREVGINLGYSTKKHDAVQTIYMSAASTRLDDPWFRSSVTKRKSDDLSQKDKVSATPEQAHFFIDLAEELYGKYLEPHPVYNPLGEFRSSR